MLNKNPFSCMKSIHKDLESSVISSGQLSATSNKNKNKLKKIVSSLLGKRRNKKMRLEKSTIKINFNKNLKESRLNLTEKNLLTSTKTFNSSNHFSIDFSCEDVYLIQVFQALAQWNQLIVQKFTHHLMINH